MMPLTRSENMSRIRGKDTAAELALFAGLEAAGLDFDRHGRTPVGRPDVTLPDERVAVFVDGCFWHGCPTHYVRPRSREDFWRAKLAENVTRDREQTAALEAAGWRVVRAWEHEVFVDLPGVVSRVRAAVRADLWSPDEDRRVLRVEAIDETQNLERRYTAPLREPLLVRESEGRRYTTKWRRLT